VLTVECHDHVQEIHRGQVYKFETDQPHLYRNDGDRVASCMCFFLDYTNIR
jgi:quercetin dioxygenase-like cupin family protein